MDEHVLCLHHPSCIERRVRSYGLMDAACDSTHDAHTYGVKRMLQAGVIPITVESLVSEWMHDWGNPKTGELVKEVYSRYGYMLGF